MTIYNPINIRYFLLAADTPCIGIVILNVEQFAHSLGSHEVQAYPEELLVLRLNFVRSQIEFSPICLLSWDQFFLCIVLNNLPEQFKQWDD